MWPREPDSLSGHANPAGQIGNVELRNPGTEVGENSATSRHRMDQLSCLPHGQVVPNTPLVAPWLNLALSGLQFAAEKFIKMILRLSENPWKSRIRRGAILSRPRRWAQRACAPTFIRGVSDSLRGRPARWP